MPYAGTPPDSDCPYARRSVVAEPKPSQVGNNPLLTLWREVCERSAACVTKDAKHLLISEADLIAIGGMIEQLAKAK